MTSEAFIIAMQSYYDKQYTKAQTGYIKAWLDGKSARWREVLQDVVFLRYTGIGPRGDIVLPNIAVFESMAGEVRRQIETR